MVHGPVRRTSEPTPAVCFVNICRSFYTAASTTSCVSDVSQLQKNLPVSFTRRPSRGRPNSANVSKRVPIVLIVLIAQATVVTMETYHTRTGVVVLMAFARPRVKATISPSPCSCVYVGGFSTVSWGASATLCYYPIGYTQKMCPSYPSIAGHCLLRVQRAVRCYPGKPQPRLAMGSK